MADDNNNEKLIEEAFISGDEAALDEVIRLYTPLAVTVIRNIAQDSFTAEDVEEAAADAFAALWFCRENIEPGCLRSYLCVIAANKTRDILRKKRPGTEMLPEDEDIGDGLTVADEVEDREISEMLGRAIDSLGRKDREIILRHYYFRQTTRTIAEKMKMPPKTVQTRLIRARQKLKKILLKWGAEI